MIIMAMEGREGGEEDEEAVISRSEEISGIQRCEHLPSPLAPFNLTYSSLGCMESKLT